MLDPIGESYYKNQSRFDYSSSKQIPAPKFILQICTAYTRIRRIDWGSLNIKQPTVGKQPQTTAVSRR